MPKTITIQSVGLNFEREPLAKPFGFKGGYISDVWQPVCLLESASGIRKAAPGTQSPLWSDPDVSRLRTENGGNALMFSLTEYALQLAKGQSFTTPIELLDRLFPAVLDFGRKITGRAELRETFALNALVPVDNAAWMLYAAENGFRTFDEMIPAEYRAGLDTRHDRVAFLPAVSYNTTMEEVVKMVDDGNYILKIKLGSPGPQEQMIEYDMAHMTNIHKAVGHRTTAHSDSGKILYSFDANCRYEKKETLLRFIEHTKQIGAFDQITLVEEPFAEEADIDCHDIPVRITADESSHTDVSTRHRIELGYSAVALKPVAKTLSMSLKIVKLAHERGLPCFCADLTVNPVLVDWNKSLAARLSPFPGIKTGILEANGCQNYKYWADMVSRHPFPHGSWLTPRKGAFELDDSFYEHSGGILTDCPHYMAMFQAV